MTLPMERVTDTDFQTGKEFLDPQAVQRSLDTLAQVFPLDAGDLGNSVLTLTSSTTARKLAFGLATVTFAGGTRYFATVPIAHGLGRTPSAVVVTYNQTADGYATATAFTSTGFNIDGGTVTGSTPGAGSPALVSWIAIG